MVGNEHEQARPVCSLALLHALTSVLSPCLLPYSETSEEGTVWGRPSREVVLFRRFSLLHDNIAKYEALVQF